MVRARRIGTVALALAALAATLSIVLPPSPASAAPAAPAKTTKTTQGPVATIRTVGYLTMADGTQLAYTVVRPAKAGKVPTLFEYSGYNPGRQPDEPYIQRFVQSQGHYAYIGVNLRGTGCSQGTFDFFQPKEALDGAAVIKWVLQQPWSSGLVGMIGKSYPGITQLFVAAQQPPGLAAIAPGHFFADAYRDVARPGGIANHGFAVLWSFVGRPSYEFENGPVQVANGDLGCLRATTGEVTGLPTNPYLQLLQHPYDDALYRERSPETYLSKLKVPMLATLAWQDEQLASRQTHLLGTLEDQGNEDWWATLTNGDHGMARTATETDDLERFYDHFLRGVDNGWASRPRVQVWWEAGRKGGARAPAWTTGLDHWSEAKREAEGELAPYPLALRGGGGLSDAPAQAGEAATGYTYTPVLGTEGPINPYYAYPNLPKADLWTLTPPPGTAASFTSGPLDKDLTVLGSASADLWLTASAPDVDLQVTITEVRPDGQEEYVNQGWLRASQRALDPKQSTALRPFQTHQEQDVRWLAPDSPVLARVEVFPFGHVFRKGSRVRMWVEAPDFLPSLWAFTPSLLPAQVQILHDPAHPSRLVLPQIPNDANRIAALPTCGLVIRQPCRPDPVGSTSTASATPLSPASVGSSPSTTSSAAGDGSTTTTGATTTTGGGGASSSTGSTTTGSAAADGPHQSLPKTGGTPPLLAALVLAVLGLGARRLRRPRSA